MSCYYTTNGNRRGTELFDEQDTIDNNKMEAAKLEGFLLKQGVVSKGWKRRWFSLIGNKLSYYVTSNIHTSKPKGIIDINAIIKVEEVLESELKNLPKKLEKTSHYCMQIVTPARSFLLMAEQEEELQYWLKGLNNYLEKQKEQKTDLLKKSQNDQPQQPINQNSQVEERYQEEISTLNSELRDLRAQLKSYQPIIDNYRNDSIKEQLTQKESELEQSNSKLQRVTQVLQSHCDQLYSVLPKLEIAESKINKLEKENEQLLNIVKHIEEKNRR